jgi:cytochrome c oxidase assembly protein subunit 15
MQNQTHNTKSIISSYYRNLTLVTVIAVYLLILAGGIVRSTGSGMGCPDWPKCFGQWVPPTSVDELPEDYQDFYAEYRHQKNIKFAKYLDVFGYSEIGRAILEDESIKEEAAFNASKTWTEYVNRLLGAVVGFLIILCVIGSLRYLKQSKTIFALAFASLVLVLIQGWIGSVVVSTNLLSWLITIHMVLALVILAVLTALYFTVHQYQGKKQLELQNRSKLSYILVVAMGMILIQIILGTQVRESLDIVADRLGEALRGSWIEGLGLEFYIHRSFSIAIVLVHFYLLFELFRLKSGLINIHRNVRILISLIILEVLSGTIMAYFAIPFWAQPIHLVVGSMIFGAQFYIFLQVVYTTQKTNKKEYAIS